MIKKFRQAGKSTLFCQFFHHLSEVISPFLKVVVAVIAGAGGGEEDGITGEGHGPGKLDRLCIAVGPADGEILVGDTGSGTFLFQNLFNLAGIFTAYDDPVAGSGDSSAEPCIVAVLVLAAGDQDQGFISFTEGRQGLDGPGGGAVNRAVEPADPFMDAHQFHAVGDSAEALAHFFDG